VSVDTNVKGKNLQPYRRVTSDIEGVLVLVTPDLVGLASRMVITTGSGLRKKLTVELSRDEPGRSDACSI
jgi:hypothetical protein